ncbi:cell division protein ZipA [Ectothiorhodospira mobilis]|uniref:cell division protein ZipA n=1 Tax=Ectothiorhodospira mobilis TaxID=195064 RepID=UPI0019062CAA|nr:cell division protein ZipA [Ectothiorhodospira mobilis]MBK1691531.1 cell division protein ZipA [Ectothiorhodospira mobilis]
MDTLRWILLILGIMILAGIYLAGRMRATRRPRRPQDDPMEHDDLEQVHIRADDPYADAPRIDPEEEAPVTEPGGDFAGDLEGLQALVNEEAKEVTTVRRLTPRPEEESGRRKAPPRPGRGLAAGIRRWLASLSPSRLPWRRPSADKASGTEPPGRKDSGEEASTSIPREEEKILVLHVQAPEGEVFLGVDLEAALEELGMRFGDMDIYHLKLSDGQREHTLFSLANMVNPGTFDPEQMHAFTTPGVSLFLRLPGPCNPVESFEAMLTCADRLAEHLGGQVLDASRSTLTLQGRQHTREEVRQWALRAGLI